MVDALQDNDDEPQPEKSDTSSPNVSLIDFKMKNVANHTPKMPLTRADE